MTNDDDITKSITNIMERLIGQQERALLGLATQPPGELFTCATPESAAKLTSTTGLNWDAIQKMSDEMQSARRKLGVAPDGNIWYRVSEFVPKADTNGEIGFYFLNTHGYYILNPDHVNVLRGMVGQMGYQLLLLPPEEYSAPGWKVPAPYDLRQWPRPLPATDGEAIERLRSGQDPLVGERAQYIFEMRRAGGESLLEAYQHTLEVMVGLKP